MQIFNFRKICLKFSHKNQHSGDDEVVKKTAMTRTRPDDDGDDLREDRQISVSNGSESKNYQPKFYHSMDLADMVNIIFSFFEIRTHLGCFGNTCVST